MTSKGNRRLAEKLVTLLMVPFVLVILIVHFMLNISCLRYSDLQRGPHLRDGTFSKASFYAMQNELTQNVISNNKSTNIDEVIINVINNEHQTVVGENTRKYSRRKMGHDYEAWRNDVSNENWFRFFKPNENLSNPHDYKYVLNNEHLCRGDIKVVIIVLSHPSRSNRRNAIRATWGKSARSKHWNGKALLEEFRVVFLLGVSDKKKQNDRVRKESGLHGDIVQEDFMDKYKNLTLKTIMGLRWVGSFCPTASYFLKTDDDVFVHVPRLLQFIKGIDRKDNYGRVMYGRMNNRITASRRGKWKVSTQSYPFKIFPKYASGGGYLLPVSMSRTLFNMSKYFPQFPIEDIFVTGILRKALEYHLHQFPALIESRFREHSAVCDIARIEGYVLVHAVTPSQMFTIQQVLAQNATGCPASVKGYKKKRRAFRRDLPLSSEHP